MSAKERKDCTNKIWNCICQPGVLLHVTICCLLTVCCVPPKPASPPDCKAPDCPSCDVASVPCDCGRCPEITPPDCPSCPEVAECKPCPELPDCPKCPEVVCITDVVDVKEIEAVDAEIDIQKDLVSEVEVVQDVGPECTGEPPCHNTGVCEGKVVAHCIDGEWVCDYSGVEGLEWGGEISCDGLDNDWEVI